MRMQVFSHCTPSVTQAMIDLWTTLTVSNSLDHFLKLRDAEDCAVNLGTIECDG